MWYKILGMRCFNESLISSSNDLSFNRMKYLEDSIKTRFKCVIAKMGKSLYF